MTSDDREPEPSEHEKTPWVRPELRVLGTMRELILGAGKTGSNLDQDPEGTFKSGVG